MAKVGASVFGGPNDPGTGHTGYRGDDLRGRAAFAELSTNPGPGRQWDFRALGGLPHRAKLRVTGPNGRTLVLEKLDVGQGGGPVSGVPRAIDLWYEAAQVLGVSGLAVVTVEPAKAGDVPSLTPIAGGGAMPGTPADVLAKLFVHPVPGARHSDDFGTGTHARGGAWENNGNDLFAAKGTPVRSPIAGTVRVGRDDGSLGGNRFHVRRPDGLEVYGAHLQSLDVTDGATVKPGERLGTVGDTGNARGTTPHLHFSIRSAGGQSVNPYPLLERAGSRGIVLSAEGVVLAGDGGGFLGLDLPGVGDVTGAISGGIGSLVGGVTGGASGIARDVAEALRRPALEAGTYLGLLLLGVALVVIGAQVAARSTATRALAPVLGGGR